MGTKTPKVLPLAPQEGGGHLSLPAQTGYHLEWMQSCKQISQIYGVQIYVPYLAANLGWKSLGPETSRAIHPAFLLRGYRMHCVKI